jgi:hypothetical protein
MATDSIIKEPECEDFVIDIPLVDLPLVNWPECCIYRVSKQLRNVNEKAYTPKIVSIGPFHHNGDGLKDMEMHKIGYFKNFLYRTGKSHEDLLKIIIDNEAKIRRCYSEDFFELKSKDFVQMILLDAIFIIELFCNWMVDRYKLNRNDYILRKPWLEIGIQHDLILLENQLPFFVLEKLYMFAFNDSSGCNHREEGKQIGEHKRELKRQDAPFVKLSRDYFSDYDEYGIGHQQVTKKPIGEEVKHFTDLLRYLLCSSVPDFSIDQTPLHTQYSAKKLDDAGLKFKAAKKKTLLEIQFHQNRCWYFDCSCLLSCLPFFKCCTLEVPPFEIHDYTEAVFRNLMALEQWHYPYHAYICNYVRLLDCLINTEEDVDLFVKKKVIVNMLGSNAAVAKLINTLCDQITEANSCYHDIAQKLNDHYDYPFNHMLATLTRVYFPDIWRGTATVVGLIVLGFTLWNFSKA